MTTSARASLRVSPSLNRMPLADFPGVPQDAAGTLAQDWLATWGIARRIAAEPEAVGGIRALGCELPELTSGPVTAGLMSAAVAWPAGLDALLTAGASAPGYAAGCRVAADLGAALGGLVATLVLGGDSTRAARPEWPAERWERWAAVSHLALGGGVVRGELGRSIHTSAVKMMVHNDIHVRIDLVEPVEHLVLRGAAARIESGVALDCGGTSLKVVCVRGHAPSGRVRSTPAPGQVDVHAVVEAIAAAAAPLVYAHAGELVPVSIALATYVDPSGQPYADQLGVYGPLSNVDTPAALTAAIERRTGRAMSLLIAHDGTTALAGAQHSDSRVDAAIVLGTAIGSGLR